MYRMMVFFLEVEWLLLIGSNFDLTGSVLVDLAGSPLIDLVGSRLLVDLAGSLLVD